MDFTLVDALRIVDGDALAECRRILAWVCLASLAAIVTGVIVCYSVRKMDSVKKRNKVGLIAFVVGSIVAMIYGGIGSGWGFTFVPETGIYDAGSYVDYQTGTLHAMWSHDPWVSSYKFKWFFSYKYGDEERGPFALPDAEVSAGHAEYQLQVPEGQDWSAGTVTCYTEYVHPINVVTNGVYHMNGVMRSIDSTNSPAPKFVSPGICIYADLSDGSTDLVAPPTNPPPSPVSVSIQLFNEGE